MSLTELLDGFLLSDRTREDIVIFADALEDAGHESACIVRQAIECVVEPRGRGGWFVGFTFNARADSQYVNQITYELATRACKLFAA